VRLLREAVPEIVLMERHRRELRVGGNGAGDHDLAYAVLALQLEHMRAHHEVRVPVAARVGAVGSDTAHLGGEMEDELWPRVVEQAPGVSLAREVVVAATGDERLDSVRSQALDEMRAEEAASSRHERAHAAKRRRPGRYGKAPWPSARRSSPALPARTALTSRRFCSRRTTRCTG